MEPEPVAAPEVAPVLQEHDVVIEEGEHTKYPAPLASHEKVLEDKELFLALLQDLCTKLQDAEPKQWRPTKFRVPTAAGQDLDLQRLYRCTTQLGGAVVVTDQHRWPEVIKPMNFPSKVNTAAIRKIYSQLLWHFEQVYFNSAAGQPLSEPPELAAAAAAQAPAADRPSAAANGAAGRARPARSRKGPSLAALIAQEDQFGSAFDAAALEDLEGDMGGSEDAAGEDVDEGGDPAAAGANPAAAAAARKPAGASLLGAAAPESTVSPSRGSAPPSAAAAAANGSAAAPAAKQRSRPQQQQQRGSGLAPGKTPELTAFLKSGRPRKDLTGASVTGKVEARFDCGYFVSITVGGLQFGGVLYCPTGTGAGSSNAGVQAQQANRAGSMKREDSGAVGDGSSRRPPAGSSVKREAGAAGLEEGSGGGRAVKRRRSYRDANDPALANKPKSAKTAFNFFAAEQWASLRGELGANAAPQDISRLIGERWNKTAEDERAPYMAMAQEDKTRYEREMETWRAGLDVAAAPTDSAAADADGDVPAAPAAAAPGGSPGADAMDVDTAAAAAVVKQEQRSATPPKPHHPKIKLKMAGTGRHTPPPPAAPAAASAGSAPEQAVVQEGSQQQQQVQQQQPAGAEVGAAVSPTLPAAEPVHQQQQQQQHVQPMPAEMPPAPPAAATAVAPAPPSPRLVAATAAAAAAAAAADGVAGDATAGLQPGGEGADMMQQ